MRKGFTLVEVLVAAALSLLLTGVLAALLVLGFKTWRHSDARSQAQEQTLMVLSTITNQVRHAYADSVVVVPQPGMDALTLVSGLGPQGTTVLDLASGEVVWQSRVVIYLQGAEQRVMLQQVPLVPPTTDLDPATVTVTSFTPGPADHVSAHNVTRLGLSLENGVLTAHVQAVVDNITSEQETSVSLLGEFSATTSPSPSP